MLRQLTGTIALLFLLATTTESLELEVPLATTSEVGGEPVICAYLTPHQCKQRGDVCHFTDGGCRNK